MCDGWVMGGMSCVGGTNWECTACADLSGPEREELGKLSHILDSFSFNIWGRAARREDGYCPPVRMDVPVPQPADVAPWLCVGDLDDAWALVDGCLSDRGITAVLTLCKDRLVDADRARLAAGMEKAGLRLLVLDARDRAHFDIFGQASDILRKAIEFAGHARQGGGRLLVHCFGGVNRAGAISVALLMLVDRMPLLQAAEAVVGKRGRVLSNRGFRRQLVQLASREAQEADGGGLRPSSVMMG